MELFIQMMGCCEAYFQVACVHMDLQHYEEMTGSGLPAYIPLCCGDAAAEKAFDPTLEPLPMPTLLTLCCCCSAV